MSKKKKKIVELPEMNVLLKIPEKAVALEIRAKLLDEKGETFSVTHALSVQEIFQARQDFLDNVELGDDYDAKFILTDEKGAFFASLAEGAEDD